jgi:hypothetical protein
MIWASLAVGAHTVVYSGVPELNLEGAPRRARVG